MERKEYLGRIKAYALAKGTNDKHDLESVKVMWRSRGSCIPCYPHGYQLSYKLDGTPRHTAILIDCTNKKCQYDVLLDEVEVAHGGKM